MSQQVIDELKKLENNPTYESVKDEIKRRDENLEILKQKLDNTDKTLIEYQAVENQYQNLLDESKRYIEDIKLRMQQIEFVNRHQEMQYIMGIHCPPYLLISSPMGFGKTRLVDTVKFSLKDQGWFCIHLQLSRNRSYSLMELSHEILRQLGDIRVEEKNVTTPLKSGYEIGRCILSVLSKRQTKNILILIDTAESISEDVAREFLNQAIVTLKETLGMSDNSLRLRVVLSGRYISYWEQFRSKMPLSSGIPLRAIQLTPFDFSAVLQTVENFYIQSSINVSSAYKQDLAAYVMYFTGGHPACMAKMLRENFERPINVIIEDEKENYKIIENVIKEIIEHIPSDALKKIFTNTLCVTRRFNPHLLKWFFEKKLIEWAGSEYDLENALLKAYLVNKESGFLKDDIMRRLLAIYLRKENVERFSEVCKESISFYESALQDPQVHRPDIITIELLFQKLQYFAYSQRGDKSLFFEDLHKILKMLVTKRDPWSIMDSFIELLRDDWEFRFMFNYLLRDHIYDEYPFDELIRKIEDFKQTIL